MPVLTVVAIRRTCAISAWKR